MPWFVNVTKDEHRGWTRAREYGGLQEGYLGKWVQENFGMEAWERIRGGEAYLRVVKVNKIPSRGVPRVQRVSEEKLEKLLERERAEEQENDDGGDDS